MLIAIDLRPCSASAGDKPLKTASKAQPQKRLFASPDGERAEHSQSSMDLLKKAVPRLALVGRSTSNPSMLPPPPGTSSPVRTPASVRPQSPLVRVSTATSLDVSAISLGLSQAELGEESMRSPTLETPADAVRANMARQRVNTPVRLSMIVECMADDLAGEDEADFIDLPDDNKPIPPLRIPSICLLPADTEFTFLLTPPPPPHHARESTVPDASPLDEPEPVETTAISPKATPTPEPEPATTDAPHVEVGVSETERAEAVARIRRMGSTPRRRNTRSPSPTRLQRQTTPKDRIKDLTSPEAKARLQITEV